MAEYTLGELAAELLARELRSSRSIKHAIVEVVASELSVDDFMQRPGVPELTLLCEAEWGEPLSTKRLKMFRARVALSAGIHGVECDRLPIARVVAVLRAIETEASSELSEQTTTTKAERVTKALLLLNDNPDWTNQRIAEKVGVSPGTLSRWPAFRKAVEILAEDGKRALPRGWKTADGVDAIDE